MQPRNNAGELPPEFNVIFIGAMLVVLAVALAILILYLRTLSTALSHCRSRNRTMEPGQVWLNLIPCWNIVWQFVTVARVAESLSNEFEDRGMRRDGDYGKSIGTAYCALNLAGAIPFVGPFFGLAGFVCFVLYWVKIAGYNRQLASRSGRGDYDDDDYDDRPRRRTRQRDEDDEDDDRDEPRGGTHRNW